MANEAINTQSSATVYDRSVQAGFVPTYGATAQSAPPPPSISVAAPGVGDVAQLSGSAKQAERQTQYQQAGAILRYTNQSLGEVENLLGETRDALEGITKKLYPPYPINSPERIALLNKVTSLRHQIDALTFPPTDQWQVKLIGDPAKISGAGDIKLPGAQGDAPIVVKAVPAYAGPGGLNLPDLPPQASDAAVAHGLARVEEAQRYVKEARASLYQQTAKIFDRIDEAQAADSSQDGRAQLAGGSKGLINSDGARATVEALF